MHNEGEVVVVVGGGGGGLISATAGTGKVKYTKAK